LKQESAHHEKVQLLLFSQYHVSPPCAFSVRPGLFQMRLILSRFGAPLLAAVIGCVGVSVSREAQAADVAITDNARNHFKAGVNLMQDPDGARYEEALREFRAAYDDSPSWKILGNLGICAMKLERDGEAIEAFETYLREGGKEIDEADREQFQRDLHTLTAGVTWVAVESLPADAVIVDRRIPVAGRPIENRYRLVEGRQRIGVRAGQHELTASFEGHESETWAFSANGGELTHSFALKVVAVNEPTPTTTVTPAESAAPEYERPVPTLTYVGMGLTGAFAVGATVTGILALGKKSDFEEVNGSDAEKAEELRDQGQTLNLVTDIMIGGAILAAGATAVIYFTRPEVEVTQGKSARRFDVAPVVLPSGGGGLWLHGSF
jgi:hypothetical protein